MRPRLPILGAVVLLLVLALRQTTERSAGGDTPEPAASPVRATGATLPPQASMQSRNRAAHTGAKTAVAGSSDVFVGGVAAYSNRTTIANGKPIFAVPAGYSLGRNAPRFGEGAAYVEIVADDNTREHLSIHAGRQIESTIPVLISGSGSGSRIRLDRRYHGAGGAQRSAGAGCRRLGAGRSIVGGRVGEVHFQ